MPQAEFTSAEEVKSFGVPTESRFRGVAAEKERAEKLKELIRKIEEQLAAMA